MDQNQPSPFALAAMGPPLPQPMRRPVPLSELGPEAAGFVDALLRGEFIRVVLVKGIPSVDWSDVENFFTCADEFGPAD